MSDCSCVDMKWTDQDGNDIETAICKMCSEDIHEVIDKKDEAIRMLGERVASEFLRAEKAEADNAVLRQWVSKAIGLMDHWDITRPEHERVCNLRRPRADETAECDCYAKEQGEDFAELIAEAMI